MENHHANPMPYAVSVLYEDDCYLVFDKPAGLLVIPTPKKEKDTLIDLVNPQGSDLQNKVRLYPCHRIDRETSGAILFAKGKKNQQLMMKEFKKRSVKKKYIGFVNGRLKRPVGEFKSAVRDFEQKKFFRNSAPKLAITRYRVREIRSVFSVVNIYPLTGRTNQIRIQFSEAGYPLLGDRKYAIGRVFLIKFRRTALHAQELEWFHPVYHKLIKVISPLPKDMEDFLARN